MKTHVDKGSEIVDRSSWLKDGIEVGDGDVLRISSGVFGRPLENPVRFDKAGFVSVRAL